MESLGTVHTRSPPHALPHSVRSAPLRWYQPRTNTFWCYPATAASQCAPARWKNASASLFTYTFVVSAPVVPPARCYSSFNIPSHEDAWAHSHRLWHSGPSVNVRYASKIPLSHPRGTIQAIYNALAPRWRMIWPVDSPERENCEGDEHTHHDLLQGRAPNRTVLTFL